MKFERGRGGVQRGLGARSLEGVEFDDDQVLTACMHDADTTTTTTCACCLLLLIFASFLLFSHHHFITFYPSGKLIVCCFLFSCHDLTRWQRRGITKRATDFWDFVCFPYFLSLSLLDSVYSLYSISDG